MKAFIVVLLILGCKSAAYGQGCDRLVEDGLYQMIKTTTRTTFNYDMKAYFVSQEFRSDLKSGKWGGSLSLPIEGVPVSINANSSDDEIREFQRKIESSSQESLAITSFEEVIKNLPNEELYEAYVRCKEIDSNPNLTGLIRGKKIETEETVIFTFYYRPTGSNQPVPKVKTFTVIPNTALVDGGGLKVGRRLPSFYMSILCKRSEVNEVVFKLQTGNGSVDDISGPTTESKFETPIGTIIASFLSFDRFREAAGENGVWKRTDKWAPCDGRDVTGSKFATYSQNITPDLRGYFLRALNSFDDDPPAGVQDVTRDINRKVGNHQDDEFKRHGHDVITMNGQTGIGPSRRPIEGNGGDNSHRTEETGGDETRPINIAVYYYIKIN